MRAAVIQSNYLPWRGYFDIIDDADVFVFHDDLQYTKGDWRNRNRIKTAGGARWITVPVHYDKTTQLIRETRIDYAQPWVAKHSNLIREAYAKAPWYERYAPRLFEILDHRWTSISELNQRLVAWVMEELGITTRLEDSAGFGLSGHKTGRLIELLSALGADRYLSGPAGANYLEHEQFEAAGITLEYKVYDYGEYPQLWGPFTADVSVIDLLFNCGPEARPLLKSAVAQRPARA